MMNFVQKCLAALAALQGAVRDHRQWINSPRARALEEGFELLAQVLTYLGLLLWIWVIYLVWFDASKLLAGAVAEAPGDALDARSMLFIVLAGAFVVPAVLFAAVFVVVWAYRLGEALANRWLPRFARCLYFPVVVLVTAQLAGDVQPVLSAHVARAWLQGEKVLASTTRHRVAYPSTPAVNPAPVVITSEELARLRSQIVDALPEQPAEQP